MNSIRNTTDDMSDPANALAFLAEGMLNGGDPGPSIERMEADGQRQLVNSDRLPTQILHGADNDEPFLALGFTFGEPDKGDPMFRPATLPEGWKREASDHAMWSHLVDEYGRRRVAIFYKAAFYDRSAFMSLETHHSYLFHLLYENQDPVLDDVWLTADAAIEELDRIAAGFEDQAAKAEGFGAKSPEDSYWTERAAEQRTRKAEALAMRARIGGSS